MVENIHFKTPRIEEEFYSDNFDPFCRAIVFAFAYLASKNNFFITLTEICRTEAESKEYYDGVDKPSGHRERPARAFDISVFNLNQEQILILKDHYNTYFKLGNYYSFIVHDVKGLHIHVQIPHKFYHKKLYEEGV